MKRSGRNVVSGLLLLGLLVVALILVLVTPITTAQRIAALSVIGVGVLWAAVLHWALSRTPEGLGRLGSSPPLVLDMISPAALLAVAFLIDGMVPRGSHGIWPPAGVAAGAVLMVPFSWTLRWLWSEWQRRRVGRPPAPAGPATAEPAPSGRGTPEPDLRGDRRPGAAEPDGPTVG